MQMPLPRIRFIELRYETVPAVFAKTSDAPIKFGLEHDPHKGCSGVGNGFPMTIQHRASAFQFAQNGKQASQSREGVTRDRANIRLRAPKRKPQLVHFDACPGRHFPLT
jgi:hypothetical protein